MAWFVPLHILIWLSRSQSEFTRRRDFFYAQSLLNLNVLCVNLSASQVDINMCVSKCVVFSPCMSQPLAVQFKPLFYGGVCVSVCTHVSRSTTSGVSTQSFLKMMLHFQVFGSFSNNTVKDRTSPSSHSEARTNSRTQLEWSGNETESSCRCCDQLCRSNKACSPALVKPHYKTTMARSLWGSRALLIFFCKLKMFVLIFWKWALSFHLESLHFCIYFMSCFSFPLFSPPCFRLQAWFCCFRANQRSSLLSSPLVFVYHLPLPRHFPPSPHRTPPHKWICKDGLDYTSYVIAIRVFICHTWLEMPGQMVGKLVLVIHFRAMKSLRLRM